MKILSIDGGGIKGLYSAAFLADLEQRFNKRIADCFDLIAGTSTGGILALALAARIPAQEIVDFYKNWGPKIFPQRFKFLRTIRSLFVSKYNNIFLSEAVKEVFKEVKIKDIYENQNPCALCITSINAITGLPYVFKTPHNPHLIRDNDHYLWELALATSAAPTYFPIVKIRNPLSKSSFNLFVDGGLWANNPSMVALTEALTYKSERMNDIYLLSLGNVKSASSFNSNSILSKGIFLWKQDIIGLTFETQSLAIHNQINLLFNSMELGRQYIRIEEPLLSKSHKCLAKMDCANHVNLNDLEVLGRNRANYEGVRPDIINLFN
jgi:uncharacterized protein